MCHQMQLEKAVLRTWDTSIAYRITREGGVQPHMHTASGHVGTANLLAYSQNQSRGLCIYLLSILPSINVH